MRSLIAYWDTLGWIHFDEGDLDQAEKYVAAAWGLGHHGEVGDHLGQIYEKRGEKDQALRTYALSMSGLRPTPETRGRLASLAGGDAKADAVKFVAGDEKLKSYTGALRTADYDLTFPDDTPVKVLRRGTLSCSLGSGKCEFVLTLPDDVSTVD